MKLLLALVVLVGIACSEAKNIKEICGKPKIFKTKGDPTTAAPEHWPWHVLFNFNHATDNNFEGVLISKNYVLVAAKYVFDRVVAKPEQISVILNPGGSHSQEVGVQEIIVHDDYDMSKQIHNIALLKLKQDVEFNDYVQPACLFDSKLVKNIEAFKTGHVVGYENNGDATHITLTTPFRQHIMSLVPQETCKASKPSYANLVTDDKFCAKNHEADKLCLSPTGAQYQVFIPDDGSDTENAPGSWYVKGLLQHVPIEPPKWDCVPSQNFIFVDVEKHLDWIQAHL